MRKLGLLMLVTMLILSVCAPAIAGPSPKLVFPPGAAITVVSEPIIDSTDVKVKLSWPKPANLSEIGSEWGSSITMKAVKPDGTRESYIVNLKQGINMQLADKGGYMEWYFGPYIPGNGGITGTNEIKPLPVGTILTVKVTATAFNETTMRWSNTATLSLRSFAVTAP